MLFESNRTIIETSSYSNDVQDLQNYQKTISQRL